ncbi:MAG: type IX secretion system outer membrane channel protein PorV [Bacteroidales bacterium]|nr:type IX secretion system outer membrane channel protein PorV [Bacteroidales bacterium]
MRHFASTILAVLLSVSVFAQLQVDQEGNLSNGGTLDKQYNVITTAVSFLTITPDSRSGGMGDAGAATTNDVWAQHSNASKYALEEDDFGVGLSYTPWLSNLGIKDINLLYLAGYKKLSKKEALGASLCYFSLGDIPAFDENGNSAGYEISPKEYSVDVSYSRFLADNFIMGMTARFIYSNLTGGTVENYHAGKAVAADISGTYFKNIKGSVPGLLTVGFNLSNIGSKISYSEDNKDFIPANLRLGAGYNMEIDKYNKVGVYFDINKLLVPTPPIYQTIDGQRVMVGGKDDDVSVPVGIFQSFYDAPGGFKEEMKEFMLSIGAEYWYNDQFAVRAGYFNEAKTKGDRKYFTAGAGLRLNVFGLDFSYLVPVNGKNSPLANTFRFSLTFDFNDGK